MSGPARAIDRWLEGYGADHRDPVNQRIHLVCVPLILWSVLALLWVVPVPEMLGAPGFWAGMAMFLSAVYYWRLNRMLGAGMLAIYVVLGLATGLLFHALGPMALMASALAVFVLAWAGQFVGHRIEGRRPSFLTDLSYLLIGPLWTLSKLYRRIGLTW